MQSEKNLNFDRIVDRKNTYSLKYDLRLKEKDPKIFCLCAALRAVFL
ncbi:MAG: hypothetical protein LUG24_09570 [Clostridiales bacterium]|nr:hypothetical protein [Clostridiales bacterium]